MKYRAEYTHPSSARAPETYDAPSLAAAIAHAVRDLSGRGHYWAESDEDGSVVWVYRARVDVPVWTVDDAHEVCQHVATVCRVPA